jgi:uncharacterized protein YcaQ
VAATLALSLERARRAAVVGQLLSLPRPKGIAEVVSGLGSVQLDPTSAVARTDQLVIWSRLGRSFRVAELERMLWQERSLFEYWVEIVPISDLPIHRETMRRYPGGPRAELVSRVRVRDWLRDNAEFRRYILRELKARGPLRARDLEGLGVRPWRSGGWNDDGVRYVALMLDVLWRKGEVMIVGRDGQQRIWDLARRSLPMDQPRLPQAEIACRLVEGQLRARGVAKESQFGWAFDGRPYGWERALRKLLREGIAVPVTIAGLGGEWFAHADVLERAFRPRTTLLSPFDDLISDRTRTEELFGFRFRLEIYVPKAKREFGYFVMPVLQGDRLIGRVDQQMDRGGGLLNVNAVYAEPGMGASEGVAVRGAIEELASWLGASDVAFGPKMPSEWRRAMRG